LLVAIEDAAVTENAISPAKTQRKKESEKLIDMDETID